MTVKELRYLVDNLDEYIHVPGGIERLKKTVLHLAVSGQLVPQDPSEGTGDELFQQIQAEKAKLIAEGKIKKQKPIPAITEAEIPFAIPKTWKWVRLDAISTLVGDGLHGTPTYGHGDYYFINGNNLGNNEITIKRETKTVSQTEYLKYRKDLNENTVLLSINGTIGNISYYNREKVVLGKSAAYINLTNGIFKYYIGVLLRATYVRKYYMGNKTGTTINNLGLKAIRELPIALPPMSEQKRIVEKVGAIFALIDELAEKYRAEQVEREKLVASSLAQLARGNDGLALTHLSEIIRTKADAAQLRKTILHLAVSGQLVPQDPAEGTGEELFQQIQAEKTKLIAAGKLKKQKPLPAITEAEIPFIIPKTWKWARPAEVGEINPRNVVDNNSEVGFIPMAQISEDFAVIPKFEVRRWDIVKNNSTHFADGDVVMAKITPCFENSKAGIIANLPNRLGAGTTELHVFRQSATLLDPNFFYLWIKNPTYLEMGKSKMTGSAGQKRIPTTFFATFPLPLPPLAEQTRIVQKTTQLLDLIAKLEPHLEK